MGCGWLFDSPDKGKRRKKRIEKGIFPFYQLCRGECSTLSCRRTQHQPSASSPHCSQPLYWVNWELREEVGTPRVPGEAANCFVCLGV